VTTGHASGAVLERFGDEHAEKVAGYMPYFARHRARPSLRADRVRRHHAFRVRFV